MLKFGCKTGFSSSFFVAILVKFDVEVAIAQGFWANVDL